MVTSRDSHKAQYHATNHLVPRYGQKVVEETPDGLARDFIISEIISRERCLALSVIRNGIQAGILTPQPKVKGCKRSIDKPGLHLTSI